MAFKGDLRNLSLFDIFQTLSTNNQTGVLVLQREGVTKKIHVSPQGVSVYFTKNFRPLRLGEIFVRRGMITQEDVEILLLKQKQEYFPMGELLVESGKVSEEEVRRVLRYHAEDEIYDVFSWDSGSFSFHDGQQIDERERSPLSDVVLDPSGLCLEAARRLDELERIRTVIPDNHEFYVQAGNLEPDREQTKKDVCLVFDALAHPVNVDELRDYVGLSLYDVLCGLYVLLEGGFARTLTQAELLDAGRAERARGDFERAAVLFEKASTRDPDDRAALEECVDLARRLDEPRRLAQHLAALGALCVRQGGIDDGIQALEQALRHDPDSLHALRTLRDALLDGGAADRAAEVGLRLARAHAERNELDQAMEACARGLEASPGSVALRFYEGQLLARAGRNAEAQRRLYELVQETESSRRAMRSHKAHDLLASCYKLLLKIDGEDERAQKGLRTLDRHRVSSLRRRNLFVRGGLAAATVIVLAVVGFGLATPDAADLLRALEAARDRQDSTEVLDLATELIEDFPESPEAARAAQIRREVEQGLAREGQEERRKEEELRLSLTRELDQIRAALTGGPPLDGLRLLGPFLSRLNKSEAASLRKDMIPHVTVALINFLDEVERRFDADRAQVQECGRVLKTMQGDPQASPQLDRLRELELGLATVRGRRWKETIPNLVSNLEVLRSSPYVTKAESAIEQFKTKVQAGRAAFDNVDDLYYTARAAVRRIEIDQAVDRARVQGRDFLQRCRFPEARKLYEEAWRLADSVADETPREHFRDLLLYLDRSFVLDDMRDEIDRIDKVVQTIAEVERLREAGEAAAAFRLFRPLVERHRLIQFEREYRMPYMVDSVPPGAEVFVNGERAGTTPLALDLDIVRSSDVRVQREGFEPVTRSLQPLDPTLDGELDVALEKKRLWSVPLEGPIEARPVLAGDLLLVASRNGSVYAVNVARGALAWEARTDVLDGVEAAPVVDGDHAHVIALDGRLFRIHLEDGAIQRRMHLGGSVRDDPVLVDGTLYAATRNGLLVAVRGDEIRYKKPLRHAPTTEVVHLAGRLYVGTGEGRILVHDAQTGEEIGTHTCPSGASFLGGLAVHRDMILAGAEDGVLYAFRLGREAPVWRFRTSGPVQAPPTSRGELIYVPAREGQVHVLDGEGDEDVVFVLRGSAVGSPCLSGEFLYVASPDEIVAFHAARKRDWWIAPIVGDTAVALVCGPRGTYVVTGGARVTAFPPDKP